MTNLPFTIYAEMTPNPATMKFVANKLLINNGEVVEFTDPDKTENSPLATKIFNFPFVESIFIASNFITITKNNLVEWEDITQELRQYILEHLKSGGEIISNTHETNSTKPEIAKKTTEAHHNEEVYTPQNEIEQKIAEILDEYVKPAVEQDGGAIQFRSYADGILKVVLKGSCSGCPSSSVTLKSGIQQLFNRMLPEVKEVVAEEL